MMSFPARYTRPVLLLALTATLHGQVGTSYRLNRGDAVQIRFFYNTELNEEVTIRPDGTISMPLIGEVRLSGKTPAEVARELENRYDPVLKNPAITVQVRQFNAQRVYVGGEVGRPGMLTLVTEQSVLDAVMEAGGPKHTGGDHVVLIRRSTAGEVQLQRVGLTSAHGSVPQAAQTMLQPFDVLLLPESKVAHVDRWVDQYVRQVLPGTLSGGFSYLINGLNGNLKP